MLRTAALGLRIHPTIKEALIKAAEKDHRTVASYVELLIINDLQARGLLAGPDRKGSLKRLAKMSNSE
jgi:hypothetical protein